MKLGPATKINKRNKTVSKRIDFILGNCDIIVIFPIYSQFGAIQERILELQSIKLMFSLTVSFYLTKIGNETKKPLTEFSHYRFE